MLAVRKCIPGFGLELSEVPPPPEPADRRGVPAPSYRLEGRIRRVEREDPDGTVSLASKEVNIDR